jgi:hypothetical protein
MYATRHQTNQDFLINALLRTNLKHVVATSTTTYLHITIIMYPMITLHLFIVGANVAKQQISTTSAQLKNDNTPAILAN